MLPQHQLVHIYSRDARVLAIQFWLPFVVDAVLLTVATRVFPFCARHKSTKDVSVVVFVISVVLVVVVVVLLFKFEFEFEFVLSMEASLVTGNRYPRPCIPCGICDLIVTQWELCPITFAISMVMFFGQLDIENGFSQEALCSKKQTNWYRRYSSIVILLVVVVVVS